MKTSNFLFLTSFLSSQIGTVKGAAECGQPRCVGALFTRGCGAACDDPCTGVSTFPPSGCFPGSGGCPNDQFCVTFEGQQGIIDLINPDNPLEEDACCRESVFCFSSAATAVVENKGKTPIKDVQVGDKVLTGSGGFETVYTVDHKDDTKETQFLQIFSTKADAPLELTDPHMVFVNGKKNPTPASKIKVGDAIQTGDGSSSIVTKISLVSREGFWNLITTDGTIVVDGVVASTYSAAFGEEHITIGGFKIMSFHDFVHFAIAPYRAMCLGISLSLCENKDGYNSLSRLGTNLLQFGRGQHELVQDLIVLGLLTIIGSISFVMNPLAFGVVFLLGGFVYWKKSPNN